MRLARRPEPFDHPDWIYEILCGRPQKKSNSMGSARWRVSKTENAVSFLAAITNTNPFTNSVASIGNHLSGSTAVLDVEIVCLDQLGRSQFYELMFRRGQPFFYAFDLLWLNGEDLRSLSLVRRKARLRKLIGRRNSRLLYLGHLERNGSGLYAKACEFDLEGIVAKWKEGSYIADNRRSSWMKIKNPNYSQAERREELFERV